MQLQLRPLLGDPTKLRVWLGIFDLPALDAVPALSWALDGRPVQATTVRPLAPVQPDGLSHTLSGVFELEVPEHSPSGRHEVSLTLSDHPEATTTVVTRASPASLPESSDETFNLLLVSCYYQPHDGGLGQLVGSLEGLDRPHLTLTVGDQVYLDNPPLEWMPWDIAGMATLLEAKYRRNWLEVSSEPSFPQGYSSVLRSAPVAAIPDDHEYWNNFPHAASFKVGTWSGRMRRDWACVARNLYDGFQLAEKDRYTYVIDVDPLCILMLDNRTGRDAEDDRTMSDSDRTVLESWVERLEQDPQLIPVIVTGPSLLQPPKKWPWKSIVDRNIANYRDYRDIMSVLARLMRAGRSVLALTGDVHYGRIAEAALPGATGTLVEIISSPSALVSGRSPLADTRGFDLDVGGVGKLGCRVLWPVAGDESMRGDHVALLQFRRRPYGVDVETTYWMVRLSGRVTRRRFAPTMRLYRRAPNTI